MYGTPIYVMKDGKIVARAALGPIACAPTPRLRYSVKLSSDRSAPGSVTLASAREP